MRDKGLGIVVALGFIIFVVMYGLTDGFAAPTQNLVGSSDVTVQQTAPGINNDISEGYLPGYVWVDQTGGAVYVAEDTTDGAAIWTDITAGGSTFNSEEGDALVTANVSVIDFGVGFDLTDSPAGETNVVLDYTEDPVDLSGSEVTGTLDLSDHVNLSAGTGATLTGDSLSVDLGTAIDTSEITDNTITEADLKVVDSPADEECFTYEATGGDFEWQTCASGGTGTVTTVKQDDVQVGDADIVTIDFGDGLTCSESPDTEINCTIDLGEAIDTTEITDGTITEPDLKVVDSPADEECLTYEATGGDFEWQTCSPGGGGGTVTTVKQDDVQVGDADIVTIDFGDGLTCSESPDTEINCTVDLGESVDLTAEVTGTLPAGNGGTGQTAATEDSVLIGNGSAFAAKVLADCDLAGDAVNYDTTTNAFSCAHSYLTTVDISSNTNLTCGANCTLTGDEISVDDSFILNTGDVGTGAYDFGGATDFEIPNGATQAPNAAGEIAVDTTDDQLKFYGGAARVLTYEYDKSVVLEDPADADNFLLWKAVNALTITDIHCIVDPADSAESVVIDIQERDGTGDSPATVDATITCDNDGAEDDGALSNGAIDAGDWISLDIGTVTGTVTQVVVTITYTVDAA